VHIPNLACWTFSYFALLGWGFKRFSAKHTVRISTREAATITVFFSNHQTKCWKENWFKPDKSEKRSARLNHQRCNEGSQGEPNFPGAASLRRCRIRVVNGPHFESRTRPSPKSQACTRPEPDIHFWSPIQARKLNLLNEPSYAQLQGIKKRSLRVYLHEHGFITPEIATTLTKTLAWTSTSLACKSTIILQNAMS